MCFSYRGYFTEKSEATGAARENTKNGNKNRKPSILKNFFIQIPFWQENPQPGAKSRILFKSRNGFRKLYCLISYIRKDGFARHISNGERNGFVSRTKQVLWFPALHRRCSMNVFNRPAAAHLLKIQCQFAKIITKTPDTERKQKWKLKTLMSLSIN